MQDAVLIAQIIMFHEVMLIIAHHVRSILKWLIRVLEYNGTYQRPAKDVEQNYHIPGCVVTVDETIDIC